MLKTLLNRQSIRPKYLTSPAPNKEALERAAAAAASAPSHGGLRPYRFVSVSQEQRELLADLFETASRSQGADEAKVEKTRSKALKGPGLVAFLIDIDPESKISETEQLLTAGAALENFMLALDAQGYGGIILSGSVLHDTSVQKAFTRKATEKVVAWVTMGTPVENARQERPQPETLPISDWSPSVSV